MKTYYHVSLLAYLPSLLSTKAFVPGAEFSLRAEERVRHVLEKQGLAQRDVERILPDEMQRAEHYLSPVHHYFWLTTSLAYALHKAGGKQKRTVYVDTPFSQKYDKGTPIIYCFSNNLEQKICLSDETIVPHRRFLRKIRAKLIGINYITQEPVPLSTVRAAIVDQADYDAVEEFMRAQEQPIPVLAVDGLTRGKSACTAPRLEQIMKTLIAEHAQQRTACCNNSSL